MSESVKTVDLGQSERKVDRLVINEGVSGVAVGLGSFTADAGASTTITDAAVTSSSIVLITPTNAPAGLLIKSKSCHVTPGSGSFTFNVSASGAGAPAGTETFRYMALLENS